MNTELLKEAVGYADGWEIRNTEYAEVFGTGDSVAGLWSRFDPIFKPAVAALASQLIEQVDAMEGVEVESRNTGEAIVWDYRPDRYRIASRHYKGGRNENSIRACVEFMRGRG